jgi:hypothetical protein
LGDFLSETQPENSRFTRILRPFRHFPRLSRNVSQTFLRHCGLHTAFHFFSPIARAASTLTRWFFFRSCMPSQQPKLPVHEDTYLLRSLALARRTVSVAVASFTLDKRYLNSRWNSASFSSLGVIRTFGPTRLSRWPKKLMVSPGPYSPLLDGVSGPTGCPMRALNMA